MRSARSPRRRSRLAGCMLASGMLNRPASMYPARMARSSSWPGSTPSAVGWRFSTTDAAGWIVVSVPARTEQSTCGDDAEGQKWGRRRAQAVDDLGTTILDTGVPQEQDGLSTGSRHRCGGRVSPPKRVAPEMGISIPTVAVSVRHSGPGREGRLDGAPHRWRGGSDPVRSARAHDRGDGTRRRTVRAPARPLRLTDIDRLLEDSADVEHAGRPLPSVPGGTNSRWRSSPSTTPSRARRRRRDPAPRPGEPGTPTPRVSSKISPR